MSRRSLTGDWTGPVWVYLLAFGAFFIRFGYGYGLGDQDEIIPYLKHLLDPSLFGQDWFVQTQTAEFSVRTYFVYALLPLARQMPLSNAVLQVYFVLWFVIAAGAYRLLLAVGLPRVSAAGAVFLSLGLLHKWTLGSNDLVYSMLVPEMAAWAIALPGITLAVKGKRTLSAILLGVSAWFQILVGLLAFGILLVEWLWSSLAGGNRSRNRVEWRPVVLNVIVFLVAAAPEVLPILLQQLDAGSVEADPSVFYILAPFRNPIHHMLLSFPTKSLVRLALLALGGAMSLWRLDRRGLVEKAGFLWRFGALTLAGCIVMAVFTEWIPVLFVAKFQLYKLTVLFKLFALGLMCGAIATLLPPRLGRLAASVLDRGWTRTSIAAVVLACFVFAAIVAPKAIEKRLAAREHAASSLGQMERWISENTDKSDVFAVPPSNSSFRSIAQRAIVVNFMAFPYNDADMVEWFRRIQDVAPVGHPRSGLNIRPELDNAFESLRSDELRSLAVKYGFDFVLREQPVPEFQPVKTIGDWTLYLVE